MTNEMTTGTAQSCPHCEQELSEQEIKALWARYTASRRQTMGAPKRQKRACQSCGMPCASARIAWSHCRIPRNLSEEELLAYVLDRMPEELVEAVGKRFDSLEDLQDALLVADVATAEKRWYVGYVDKAMGKLEDVA